MNQTKYTPRFFYLTPAAYKKSRKQMLAAPLPSISGGHPKLSALLIIFVLLHKVNIISSFSF